MPRPPETRLRRFMMQTIMWLIFGATVGVAALVDRQKARKLEAKLGEITNLENGISIRLPVGWSRVDEVVDSTILIAVRDFDFQRAIIVRMEQLSLSDLFTAPRGSFVEQIPMGDGTATLRSRKTQDEEDVTQQYSATRSLTRGRILSIILQTSAFLPPAEAKRDRELIKQVAASLEVAPDVVPQVTSVSQPATAASE